MAPGKRKMPAAEKQSQTQKAEKQKVPPIAAEEKQKVPAPIVVEKPQELPLITTYIDGADLKVSSITINTDKHKVPTIEKQKVSPIATKDQCRPPSPSWYECNDVLHHIFFNFLGLPDVLSCRLVCKVWHLSLRDIHHIRRTLCCRTHNYPIDDVFWLCPEIEDMHVCPRPAGTTTCWKNTLKLALSQRTYSRCVVAASSHGLVCLQLDDGKYTKNVMPSLVVCNPVRGTHKLLPNLTFIDDIESVGMHFNLVAKSYTVLVIGIKTSSSEAYFHDNGDPVKKPFYVSHVEMYHSEFGCWQYLSHAITDLGVKKGNIAWWEGQYYWVIQKQDDFSQMLAYDMTRKQWSPSPSCNLPKKSKHIMPKLFVWEDSLFCKFQNSFYMTSSIEYEKLIRPSSPASKCATWQHESIKERKSLNVAAHFSTKCTLHVCIFDPYSFTPAETSLTSSQRDIIRVKRESNDSCFSFTPCLSAEV